jgi:hypothetical protein
MKLCICPKAIFLYKQRYIDGTAPCDFEDSLSLAICKPAIRNGIKKDHYVLSFSGVDFGERFVHAFRVDRVLEKGSYYFENEWAHRPDCIYFRQASGQALLKPEAKIHRYTGALENDVGPNFEKANVLLASKGHYVYKGLHGAKISPAYPKLKKFVERQGLRPHRKIEPGHPVYDEVCHFLEGVFAASASGPSANNRPSAACGDKQTTPFTTDAKACGPRLRHCR